MSRRSPAPPAVVVGHVALRRLAHDILVAAGSEEPEAAAVAGHLVEANLRGHDSHGVGLLPMYVHDVRDGHLKPNLHATLVRHDGAIAVFDGGMGYGHVGAMEAARWGIAEAGRNGVAIVGLRNAYHIARVGTYGEAAAEAGMIAILFVNVFAGPQRVAPFGGADGRLHTNPICMAVPAGEGRPPFILDFATSRIALGKVRVAYNQGAALKPDIVIDAAGRPSSDPTVMFEAPVGAVLPFGEHKGSGLAVVCELLAGALTGGPANHSVDPPRAGVVNNLLGIFIDPARLDGSAALPRRGRRRHRPRQGVAAARSRQPGHGRRRTGTAVAGTPARRGHPDRRDDLERDPGDRHAGRGQDVDGSTGTIRRVKALIP